MNWFEALENIVNEFLRCHDKINYIIISEDVLESNTMKNFVMSDSVLVIRNREGFLLVI